jgi:hypothetical protein
MFPKWRQIYTDIRDHKNILLMNYSWFILSATTRPFQDAKVCGELVCSKCIENNEEVKFF